MGGSFSECKKHIFCTAGGRCHSRITGGRYSVRKPLPKPKCGFLRHLIALCTMEALPIAQMHRVGYARVSSVGQNLDSQVDAWQKAGCQYKSSLPMQTLMD